MSGQGRGCYVVDRWPHQAVVDGQTCTGSVCVLCGVGMHILNSVFETEDKKKHDLAQSIFVLYFYYDGDHFYRLDRMWCCSFYGRTIDNDSISEKLYTKIWVNDKPEMLRRQLQQFSVRFMTHTTWMFQQQQRDKYIQDNVPWADQNQQYFMTLLGTVSCYKFIHARCVPWHTPVSWTSTTHIFEREHTTGLCFVLMKNMLLISLNEKLMINSFIIMFKYTLIVYLNPKVQL